MPSEKSRYFIKTDPETEKVLSDIDARFHEFIQQKPKENAAAIILTLSSGNFHINKEIASRHCILTRDETDRMLHSVIDLESDDNGIIHQHAEDAVQRIATALM